MNNNQKNQTSATPKRIVNFLFGLWRISPKAAWGMVVTQVMFAILSGAIAPIFVAKLLSHIANGSANLHNSKPLLIGYVVTLIFSEIIAVRITIALAFYSETKMQMHTAEQVMKSQTEKSLSFHSNHMSGGIVSDMTKLHGSIERFWDTLVFTAVPIAATIVAVCVALAFIFWQYSLLLALLSSAIAILIVRAQQRITPVSREVSEKSSAMTAYFADTITNMQTVKAFAGEKSEQQAYRSKILTWRKTSLKEMRRVLYTTGSFGVMMTIMNACAFLVAIIATEHHIAAIGTTYLVIGYTLNVVSYLWQVGNTTRSYTRIIGDAGPMIAMLDETVELTNPDKPEKVKIVRGDIRFKDVTFAHDGSKYAIFTDLNLHIKPGEKVGLVGRSGSGKTTLTRLLLRFSDLQSGAILLDGQDATRITQADLRRHIAYVPQEPLLFHRTVRENIAYGDPEMDQTTIEAIARMASAHEFIEALPHGYDTLVGERGVKLSGGQRQRVAIARAMLKNAPILALDEATSALDSESEVLIQAALWKLMEGRTAIVIAHRLSTIQKMDRIIVLDDGKIVEEGSHKELLQKKGTYAKLWAHQSGGFIEE